MRIRYCINDECRRPITVCNGYIVARDMVEHNEGRREAKHIREFCGSCVFRYFWEGITPLFKMILQKNPIPWSPS
jgi:hypothetical protein